jgi:hypothetical protein
MSNLQKKDKYTVFLDSNHPLVKISTNIKNGRKLLVIKDSFANCLIPFLTGHCSEIYVMDPRYYDDNLGELVKSNDIEEALIVFGINSFFQNDYVSHITW